MGMDDELLLNGSNTNSEGSGFKTRNLFWDWQNAEPINPNTFKPEGEGLNKTASQYFPGGDRLPLDIEIFDLK
jgi:hypothetical protein